MGTLIMDNEMLFIWPLHVAFAGPGLILDRFPRLDAFVGDDAAIRMLFVVVWIPFCVVFIFFGMCLWCPVVMIIMAIIGILKLLWRLLKWVR